ncbi:hypothetical protein [Bradyrhizobium sp. SK17]|uniref:hypothetical protein n=1 Tax=Bradyrhizobium sp. SK17 TaxID=2057741 RepID=UPI0012FE5354|nr:hypothetical protein [Bradyrhizobium sp. SK17]
MTAAPASISRKAFRVLYGFALTCVIATSYPALAQNPDRLCYNNMVGIDPKTVSLYEAAAPMPTHFIHGDEGGDCPGADTACQKKAYIVKGNQVVVTRSEGEYACATFVVAHKGKAVATAGWLPLSSLRKIEPAPRWPGHWLSNDRNATIDVLTKDPDRIEISGSATWSSTPTNLEEGDFSAIVDGKTNFVSFTSGDGFPPSQEKSACALKTAQLGSYLVVTDNHNCGGHNLTFSGVYVRKE